MEIIVKLTTGCNLHCVYCSEGDKALVTLKKEYLYRLIDELPAFLDENNERDIVLLWHGGEPMTVGIPYLREVMTYAKEKLMGYNLRFTMQTNLTLLNDDWISLIKEFNIGMGVSFDGYKELHDANRKTKDGKPTYDLVMANMKKLQNNGIHFGTLMVLDTAKPVDVEKLYALIKDNHLSMKIHPVIPCGRAAGTPDASEIYKRYIEVLEKLYEKAIQDLDFEGTIEPVNEMLRAILSGGMLHECSYTGLCGQKFLSLYSTGEIGFCGRAEADVFRLGYGHLKDSTLSEIYHARNAVLIRNRQEYLKKHECGKCPDWRLCHGGCAFEARNAFGTLEAKYPNCEPRRQFIHYLKTTGLDLLKKRLIAERNRYRMIVKSRKQMIRKLENEYK